jgi:hypothetical protein
MGDVDVYIGRELQKGNGIYLHKSFVFDLDETIGAFGDLYLLCKILNAITLELHNSSFMESFDTLYQLFELYPEFIRPGIEYILQYIYVKKREGICDGVYIYTNNQCIPESWTQYIISCVEKRSSVAGLINNIVLAFKINNKVVDPRRKTSSKTYTEFVKCVKIPNNSSICFIDNGIFKQMQNENVYYIQPPPYFHNMSMIHIITRLVDSNLGSIIATNCKISRDELCEKMYNYSQEFGRYDNLRIDNTILIEKCYNIDISKKIMYYVREYLFYSQKKRRKTMSRRKNALRETRRIRKTNYKCQ